MMEKKVEYKVSAVTVYTDRARITCIGLLQVASGQQTLLFDDLPLSMEIDSVRVGGRGKGPVDIIGVEVVRQHFEQSPSTRVVELDQKIESMSNDLGVLEDEEARFSDQADYLKAMLLETREYAKGLSRGRTSVDDQAKLLQYIAEQDEGIRGAQREVRIKKRKLVRQLDKLHRELEEIQKLRPRQRYQARVDINAAQETEFQPELTCIMHQAGWEPLYDVRFSGHNGTHNLGITTLAQVTQNTGQDWSDVALSVSTVRPALNQRLPVLHPWFIDEYHPPQPRQLRAQMARAEPSMAVVAAASPSSDVEVMEIGDYRDANAAPTHAKEGESAVTFDLSGQWDIPSDGSPHKVTLSSFDQEPTIDYVTVPRHTEAVYRRAIVLNIGVGPLLAGMATLFADDEFIGKTKMNYTPLKSEIELLLGVEEKIEVERKLTKREVDKRLLRENRTVRYAYEIVLENLKDEVVNIEVQDQIPVSKHEQIKIKLDNVRPEPDEQSDLNLIEWQPVLESKEKKKISYEFVVEHPRSLRIGGIPD